MIVIGSMGNYINTALGFDFVIVVRAIASKKKIVHTIYLC